MQALNVRIRSHFTREITREDVISIAIVSSMTSVKKRKILLGWFINNSLKTIQMAEDQSLRLKSHEIESVFSSPIQLTSKQQEAIAEIKSFHIYEHIMNKLEKTLKCSIAEMAGGEAW